MNNNITLQSYETGITQYVNGTAAEISGNFKIWIDSILKLIPQNARIIEIGSAFGRDALYMESQGFSVERTDAAIGFVNLLKQKGYSTHTFNILTDEYTASYDLVFANAVFLHFTPEELQKILDKTHPSLTENGILAFSVKQGEGEEWTNAKVGNPRYFCYWTKEKIQSLLKSTHFELVEMAESEKFLQIIAKKKNPIL